MTTKLKRIAILIAGADYSPKAFRNLKTGEVWGKSHNELMEEDIEKIKRFLETDIGGKWIEEEIICFPNVHNLKNDNLVNEVEKFLTDKYDYLFFYYVGHGTEDELGNEAMRFLINDERVSKELFVDGFKSFINRGGTNTYLAIMNFCRASDTVPNINMPCDITLPTSFNEFKGDCNKYLNEIKMETGEKIVIYSTKKGCASLFSDKGGVYFSECFLKAILNWAKKSETGSVYRVSDVINDTNQLMSRLVGYQQKAEIEDDKFTRIPIAVK